MGRMGDRPANIPLLRLGWRYGTKRDRAVIAYFALWTSFTGVGFAILIVRGAPLDVVISYSYVLTFGLFLYPVWYAPFLSSVPVLQGILRAPSMDETRRPLFETMLAHAERHGTDGRFPNIDRITLGAAIVNALFPPFTLLFVSLVGIAEETGRVSSTPFLYAAIVFPAYLTLFAVTMIAQRRFAQRAEAQGYPIWSLAREFRPGARRAPEQGER